MIRRLRLRPVRFRRHVSTHPQPKESPKEAKEQIDIPNPSWYQRLGPVTRFFGWYHRAQTNRPYVTQLVTGSIVYLTGDLLAQEIGGEKYDGKRTLRILFTGVIHVIPGYKWFLFLGNHFNYSSKWLSIFVKIVVQQTFYTPIFNTYFFGMQAILTGESPSGVIQRIKETVPTSVYNSLKLWPAVTAFAFTFIQAEYRFLFGGFFAICWQSYLSFLNRNAEKSKNKLLS